MKIYHMKAWNPKINEVAQNLISDIYSVVPDLEVLFMGAAALGLPGTNDIDIDILSNVEEIPINVRKLIPVLGTPIESMQESASWNFYICDIEIDAIISDPKKSHVPEQKRVFEILKATPSLLEEYKQLKIKCDGMIYSEYKKKKNEFFRKRVLKKT